MDPSKTELAYIKCRELALNHYENFPVGSVLVPSNKRKYVYAVYAFARYADDIADSSILGRQEKLQRLELLKARLDLCESSGTQAFDDETGYIFAALQDAIPEIGADLSEFRDLLSAFSQDAAGWEYGTVDDLMDYSSRSANPIGHLVLNIFGYKKSEEPEMFALSDSVCTALQLTNFWQDVSEDLKINRVYIPAEAMKKHGYDMQMLRNKVQNESFRNMMTELCRETSEMFDRGEGIVSMTKGRLKLELKATIAGGRMILEKIKKMNYGVLNDRPALSGIEKAALILKSIF